MEKPEKRNTNCHYNQENCAYNQGLADMETYYKESELSEEKIKTICICEGQRAYEAKGSSRATQYKAIAKAIISARDKKRKE